jgi:hypothetical protein
MNEQKVYFMEDKYWYNPVNVIYEFEALLQKGVFNKDTKKAKKAKEMYIGAIFTIGLVSKWRKDFWIQMVDDKEESPDVKTICRHPERQGEMSLQDMEIVTMGKWGDGSITDFLLKTKLSSNKAYDDFTNVVCFIDRELNDISAEEININLLKHHPDKKYPVFLLVQTHPTEAIYKLVQIYPVVDMNIDFDLYKECQKITYPAVFIYSKVPMGKKRELSLPDTEKPINPFEKLNL